MKRMSTRYSSLTFDNVKVSKPFASVTAEPSAKLDRLKYLLLLWPASSAPDDALAPNELFMAKEGDE